MLEGFNASWAENMTDNHQVVENKGLRLYCGQLIICKRFKKCHNTKHIVVMYCIAKLCLPQDKRLISIASMNTKA